MPKRLTLLTFVLIVALALLSGGCKKKPVETEPAPPPPAPVEPAPEPEPVKEVTEDFEPQEETQPIREPGADELNQRGLLQTVYFDFDKYDLDDDDRATLAQNADQIRQYPKYKVVIEGHCDERGTIEYNLALGERRANAVREYMSSLGVSISRMRIVSFGEERPAVAGSGEAAWSKNRRAEFRFEP